MMLERITNQKQLILDYLITAKTHPSAEEIFYEVKKYLPRISLGTIYRNLENFVQKKIIKEIPGEIKRFDADLSIHHHFICKSCKNVFDLNNFSLDINDIENKTREIGFFDDYKFLIYGICKKCNKK